MKGYKKIWALFLVVAVLTGLSACGSKGNDNALPTGSEKVLSGSITPTDSATPGSQKDSQNVPTGGKEQENKDQPYTVVLPDGTSITLEKVPERIVSVGPNITDILFKIGAGDKVVGRTDYCDEPEQVKDIPSIGSLYAPDIEKIVELEPDLVLGSIHFYGEAKEKLDELKIPVAVLYDCETIDGVYNTIRTAGELVGKAGEGSALADETKQRIDSTIEKYSGAEYADFKAPTVYYVVDYGENGDFTAGGNTFIGNIITAAGGKNIAEEVDGWQIAHEVLIEKDPEIIIVRKGEANAFCSAPGYEELGAVKNGKVYEFDTEHQLDRQGYQNADIFIKFAELFHGQAE